VTEAPSTGIEATTTGSEATATVAESTSTESEFALTDAAADTFKTVTNALVSVARVKGLGPRLKRSETLQLICICAKLCG